MKRHRMLTSRLLAQLVILFCLVSNGLAQVTTGGLTGQVTDPTGAAIPGATVTVKGAGAAANVVTTDEMGRYTIPNLTPGKYTVSVAATGFSLFQNPAVEIAAGPPQTLNVQLKLAEARQEVTVTDTTTHVDVEPTHNAGALVLKGEDLEALSDDPDDLQADLQALAGPSAGPDGGQIYIDGFTGGRLPPKESIREIRINQNPFSAEYDKLGYGRIEIFTKPGTDKFHGQAYMNFNDSVLNARNPFSPTKPASQTKMFGGNFGGPLTKKSSFFVDIDRHSVQATSVVNAVTLDSSLNPVSFSDAIVSPNVRTTVSPRIDYQLTPGNTLTARYSYTQTNQENQGIGQFSLPSQAYNGQSTEQTFQVTETAMLSLKMINETRFQYVRERNSQAAVNTGPTVTVLDAFTGGASPLGRSSVDQDNYELQNYTSITQGKHMIKFGGRLRGYSLSSLTTQNYNGTFTFTSLDAYRTTLVGLQNGLTADQIRAQGGMPSQFSITGGNPLASVSQFDLGVFVQDDWRALPNLTLSGGLRYETQNHISDHRDVAPRLGFAWGLGGKQPKTVLRGGFGIFYSRFGEDLTLQAIRLNGILQQQYLVPFPSFFPTIPSLDTLAADRLPTAIRKVASDLRAPYTAQTALSLERQLPKNIQVALTYVNSRGVHMLRSRNINAPLPGTYDASKPNSGVRPYGGLGDIYLYESSGMFKQNQLIATVNARVNARVSLFGFYTLNNAKSDTDGPGTFPADQYELSSEYGRAAFDVRHRMFVGGSLIAPFGIRFSPFIVASSGRPFNITIGRDINGDSLYTDRPAFATDLSRPSVVVTPYGAFDTQPLPGQVIIPRNYGSGPGMFSLNLRLSRVFGFGGERSAGGVPSPSGPRGGGHGGPGLGGPRGGFHALFADTGTSQRYNIIFSVVAHNLLNNVNLAPPVGNLSSPLFGTSNAIAGNFGPAGMGANRRIDMQLRFTF
jgi:hypothetical protein